MTHAYRKRGSSPVMPSKGNTTALTSGWLTWQNQNSFKCKAAIEKIMSSLQALLIDSDVC